MRYTVTSKKNSCHYRASEIDFYQTKVKKKNLEWSFKMGLDYLFVELLFLLVKCFSVSEKSFACSVCSEAQN